MGDYKELVNNYHKDTDWHSDSLYNFHDVNLEANSKELHAIKNFHYSFLKGNILESMGIKKLTDINFNDNDNSFNKFKDLCEIIHAAYAFYLPHKKQQLSTICDSDFQLDDEKIKNLHEKLQSIADPQTGKTSEQRLNEYTSDKTVMDFIRMVLSYLPQVIKDSIGLDEESR